MAKSPDSSFSLVQWLRRPWGLAVAVMVVFGVIAGLPWLRAAVKVAGGKEPVTLAAVKAEQEKEEEKGKKEYMKEKEPGELKAVLALDGDLYVAGKGGFFFSKEGTLSMVQGVTALDPRGLAVTAGGELLLLDKKAVKVRGTDKVWKDGPELEAHTLTASADGFVYAPSKKGLQRTRDGLVWETVITPEALAQAAGLPLKEKGKEREEKPH